LLNNTCFTCESSGALPYHHTIVEVSSDDDDAPKVDALAVEPRAPADDETDGEGVSLAEPITLGPISSNMSAQANPSIADQVASSAPSAGGQKQKCPPPVPNCKSIKSSADQVMIQIELPPYHGPRHPLDLVALEIVLGSLFEVF
jgi:hypothetical protein